MEEIIIDKLTWKLQVSSCDICRAIGIENCKECIKIYCG